jgi:hypothetical protein
MAAIRLGLALGAAVVALLLALPIVALGLPVWLTALLVRALAGRLQPSVASWQDLVSYDPVLGWRARPDLEADVSDAYDDVFRVRTGPDGWHGRGTIEDSEVVVLGDSHAFGFGVDADATFAAVSREPRIKALGAPGYNMVQELLLLRAVQARLGGRMVVWLVYTGNDIYDNLTPSQPAGQRAPFLCQVEGDWEIVSRHLSPERWTASSGRGRAGEYFSTLAALHGPTHLAERAYGACAFLIEQAAEICERVGARLVVMTMPSPFVMEEGGLARLRAKARQPDALDPDRPDRELHASCAKVGIEFVTLRDHLRRSHFKATDDHLTEAGHRALAGVLRSLYASQAER